MAIVQLTFRDDPDDGSVRLTADFDPPISRDEDPTPSQVSAVHCIQFIQARAGGVEAMCEFLNDSLDEMEEAEEDPQ